MQSELVHDDGLVALDPQSGIVFSANRIGALIWTQLEQRISLDAIASDISRAYRIDRPERALGLKVCRPGV